MQNANGVYTSLDAPFTERASYAWWWRVVAFASSWMILAGFLMLPPLFEDKPALRTSGILFTIFTVALLTAGFALTALLYCACRDWQYRLDVIFLPGLTSSTLGLFVILYNFAISTRYQWRAAAIVGTAIGVAASLIYFGLCILAYRRKSSSLSDNPSWPSQRLRNLFPRSNPRISVSGEAPVEIITGEVSTYDELTRQQMLNLLKQRERRHSEASLRSTYNIEWPQTPQQSAADRLAMPLHVQEYYSPLNSNPTIGQRLYAGSDTVSLEASRQSMLEPGPRDAISATTARERSRSRDARRMEIEHAEERERSRSRDIRRRELETGSRG